VSSPKIKRKDGKKLRIKNSLKLVLIVLAVLMLFSVFIAAISETAWNKTFGGPDDDFGYSVQQTSDGGYIIAGETASYGVGGGDVWLIKTDSDGKEEWNKTFGGPDHDSGYSVKQTSDRGYIIVGKTTSHGVGGYISNTWLIKTDSNGNKQWSKTFGGLNPNMGYSVKQTSDGGYIIVGSIASYGAASEDVWLIKTNSDGKEEWNKTFGGLNYDSGYSIQQTSDEGYIIVGATASYGAGSNDVWLLKTNFDGKEEWNKTFGGSTGDSGHSVQQTSDGGYIIVGDVTSYGAGRINVWLIKTGSDGKEEWNKTFASIGGSGNSVQQTSDGGYIIAGYSPPIHPRNIGDYDIWLMKTDSNGNKQWIKNYGGKRYDQDYSVQQTSDGGYVIVGYTRSYGAGSNDVWLIKVRSTEKIPTLVFGVPFAIIGLLVMVYLLRRKK
jgi:hypothetical protein